MGPLSRAVSVTRNTLPMGRRHRGRISAGDRAGVRAPGPVPVPAQPVVSPLLRAPARAVRGSG